MSIMNGFTDMPIETAKDDTFGVGKYIDGLSSFIVDCQTPMTIAIQGDWGSGKTSVMQMVREKIADKVVPLWFNTWQYSQFSMDQELTMAFLQQLLKSIGTEDGNTADANRTLNKLWSYTLSGVKVAAKIGTGYFLGSEAAKASEKIIDRAAGAVKKDDEIPNVAEEIAGLKNKLQSVIDAKCQKTGKDRIVIFVDDLDRLNPGKAVEMLEVLKLFLDCKKCIFILAIDYAVVSQGIKAKYGDLIGTDKGRSFFDKIIQVPFKMPVLQYDICGYVRDFLNRAGIGGNEETVNLYMDLVQKSVGSNPRAMKRLFNAFLLLRKVYGYEIKDIWHQNIMFALLCLQHSYDKLYEYIVLNPDDCTDKEFMLNLQNRSFYMEKDVNDGSTLWDELKLDDAGKENKIKAMAGFMKIFCSAVAQPDLPHEGEAITEKELAELGRMISMTALTSNITDSAVSQDENEKYYRDNNRHTIWRVAEELRKMSKELDFAVYQPRKDREGFRKFNAQGIKWFEVNGAEWRRVAVIFRINTDIENSVSELRVLLASEYKESIRDKFAQDRRILHWLQTVGKEKGCHLDCDDRDAVIECGDCKKVESQNFDGIVKYFTAAIPPIVESFLNAFSNQDDFSTDENNFLSGI